MVHTPAAQDQALDASATRELDKSVELGRVFNEAETTPAIQDNISDMPSALSAAFASNVTANAGAEFVRSRQMSDPFGSKPQGSPKQTQPVTDDGVPRRLNLHNFQKRPREPSIFSSAPQSDGMEAGSRRLQQNGTLAFRSEPCSSVYPHSDQQETPSSRPGSHEDCPRSKRARLSSSPSGLHSPGPSLLPSRPDSALPPAHVQAPASSDRSSVTTAPPQNNEALQNMAQSPAPAGCAFVSWSFPDNSIASILNSDPHVDHRLNDIIVNEVIELLTSCVPNTLMLRSSAVPDSGAFQLLREVLA